MRRLLLSAAIMLCLAMKIVAEPAGPPRDSWSVDQLIDALTDPDAAHRKAAADRLVLMGASVRPRLLKAAQSDDPEQRAQAAAILKKLPWWTDEDPPNVRALLERYGGSSETGRVALIRRLDDLSATDVLLRLLKEETSDAVRWNIVSTLGNGVSSNTLDQVRAIAPDANDPPTLTLAGVAWLTRDRDRALSYFRQAIDADDLRPSNDGGRLGVAFDELVKHAMSRSNYDEAAALLRRQVPREMAPRRQMGITDGMPYSMAVLFTLHEYFGPLAGYARDLATFNPPLDRRTSALAGATRLLSALGAAPPAPQGITRAFSADDRYVAAIYFVNRELNTVAELEFRGTLAMSKPNADLYDARILFHLAHLMLNSADDLTVAELLDRAMQIRSRSEFELRERSQDDVLAEIHWRRARAAQRSGDEKSADEHVAKLLALTPTNSDSTINAINRLRETTRHRQAKLLFDKIYEQGKARLESSPDRATQQNDLAWFCARTGNRLEEALKLAQSAVEAQPQNDAYLDTLAECHFRVGNREEAIKCETRALELKPESKFFREQLARFRAGQP